MTADQEVVQVASNGRITLPNSIRRKANLSDGDLLRAEITEDGQIILTPLVVVDRTQGYFWTLRWQAGEREAEEDLKSGRSRTFNNIDDLIKDLTDQD